MIEAKVILDSLNPYNGTRLTTLELTYPRFVHSEFMTHRMFSRNAASSRAIPIEKFIKKVKESPAMPVFWGAAQKGMVAANEIENIDGAIHLWLEARDSAISFVERLNALGLHKQIPNRILEPWFDITVICSATEFSNFFRLRRHPDAQPEIKMLADFMHGAMESSTPVERLYHLPYIMKDEMEFVPLESLQKISSARCARVSYLTHDGKRDHSKDLELFQHLITGSGFGHWSPMEHVATAVETRERIGNFVGWRQYRKEFAGESGEGNAD